MLLRIPALPLWGLRNVHQFGHRLGVSRHDNLPLRFQCRLGENREPRLNHGDLRLKNTLVDASGQVCAVIDWEFATAAPAPEWDLAVALHDLSIDGKDAFIDGYGLDVKKFESLGPALAALNVLHYAPFADAAARSAV